MSAIAIHAWLQGAGNYAEGLALLRTLPDVDQTDLWFLELGETSLSRQQLRDALSAAHASAVRSSQVVRESAGKSLVTKADVQQENSATQRDVTSDGYAHVRQMPPALRALHDKVREWSRERDYLRFPERMEKLPSDADRLRDALRVIELDELVVRAYARLDTWRDTGRDPGEAAAPQTKNGAQLEQELQNIKTYLSRHRSGKRPSSPAKVAQWEKQAKDIQALIDALPA